MSQRSVSRAHRRRLEATAKREARLRRAGLIAGGVLGAAAVAAPAAQADTFVVTTTDDTAAPPPVERADGDLTLRDAVAAANATDGADTITFASGLTGTIRLTGGRLTVAPGGLTITGPGSEVLSVSGDADADGEPSTGDTGLFTVSEGAALDLGGLTLTRGGFSESKYSGGGAVVVVPGASLELHDAALTENVTDGVGFGGALLTGGSTTIRRSTFSGNSSFFGGAVANLPVGGDSPSPLVISDSAFTGNASFGGGAIASVAAKYGAAENAPMTVTNSTFTDNDAQVGGAVLASSGGPTSTLAVTGSTFSGNDATDDGGALAVQGTTADAVARLDGNTFVGNTAVNDGGALSIAGTSTSDLAVSRSTFTGNAGSRGGAITIGQPYDAPVRVRAARAAAPTDTGVELDALTVAGNTASQSGGGIFLTPQDTSREVEGDTVNGTEPGTQVLTSSIVAGNAVVEPAAPDTRAPGDRTADDLGQTETTFDGAGFVLRHALVQAPITAPFTTDDALPSLLGVDPALGALADNGGPTQTLLPASGSPVVDAGKAASGVTADQRGAARPADQPGVTNAVGGDGSDIGAVELALPAPEPTPEPTPGPTQPATPAQPAQPPAPVPPATIPTPPAGTTAVGLPAPISRPGAVRSTLRQPITLRGTAGTGTSKVRVSVARKVGKKCRFLLDTGKFSKVRDCRRTLYVTATGTTSWRLKLPTLAKGRYTVWSRAIVKGKLVEKKKTSRNFRRFTIR